MVVREGGAVGFLPIPISQQGALMQPRQLRNKKNRISKATVEGTRRQALKSEHTDNPASLSRRLEKDPRWIAAVGFTTGITLIASIVTFLCRRARWFDRGAKEGHPGADRDRSPRNNPVELPTAALSREVVGGSSSRPPSAPARYALAASAFRRPGSRPRSAHPRRSG